MAVLLTVLGIYFIHLHTDEGLGGRVAKGLLEQMSVAL